jgi:hypothetical protein
MPVTEDGRFRIALPAFCTGDFVMHCTGLDDHGTAAEVKVTGKTPLVAGRNEIGDVVVTPSPLLVSGRIIGPGGTLPAGVELEVERLTSDSWLDLNPNSVPLWSRIGLPSKVAPDGTFAVRSLQQDGRYRLQVRGACCPHTIEFAPGTADLMVQVTNGASLTATFLYDPAVEVCQVKLVASVAPPPESRFTAQQLEARLLGSLERLGDRFRVRWRGLAPGDYHFVVANAGIGTIIDWPLSVADGGLQDPRLVDIDLRNRVHATRVTVTDRDGKRLPTQANIYFHGSAAPAAWIWGKVAPDDKSLATFASMIPADVYVLASGYRGRSAHGVTSDIEIALDPAPTVTLRCAQLTALPAGITAGLLWLPATPLNGATPGADGMRPRPTSVEDSLITFSLPQELVAGVATLRGESSMPLGLDLLLSNAKGYRQRVPMSPTVLDPLAFVNGETIELTVDDEALKQALEIVAKH